MKKETADFVMDLLIRELENEFIQANGEYDPLDLDYVRDLIRASKDFVKLFEGVKKYIYEDMLTEAICKLINCPIKK